MRAEGASGQISAPPPACRTVALDLIEPHVVRGEKIGAGLHALGDGAGAVVLGQLDDAPAYCLLQPVIRAAVDVLLVDLQFGERETPQLQQRRPFRADIVDGDRDIVQAQTSRGIHRPTSGCVDHLAAVDFDQESGECGVGGHGAAQSRTAARIAEERYRQVDRKIDRTLALQQIAPVLDGAADHEFGQRAKMRILVVGNEIGRRHHAPRGMPHPDQRLRAARRPACGC